MVPPVLRALSICAPAAFLDAPAALAQTVEPTAPAGGIPAQPLARALEAFATQTGLQLVYVSGVVRNQRAHAVPAGLGVSESLARMLEGTNLTFEYLTPRSIRILAAPVGPPTQTGTKLPVDEPLQEVIVTANLRAENAQHVPMTLQVMTEATLARLKVTTFDDFVAYRADIASGIELGRLTPFHYVGVKDDIDYENLPWRNRRFDPEALSRAAQTEARMQTLWRAWGAYGGERTLVFCCSIAHASYVRAWLRHQGVKVAAVYAGDGSDDREQSLADLERGELAASADPQVLALIASATRLISRSCGIVSK